MASDSLDAFRTSYYDSGRTHQIRTSAERHELGLDLIIVERPFGSTDPTDAVTHVEKLAEPWEVKLALRELEQRLIASGKQYHRVVEATGELESLPHRPKQAVAYAPRAVPLAGDLEGRRVEFQFYRDRDRVTLMQIAIPRADLDQERYIVATLRFRFPDVTRGDLQLVHRRMAPGPLHQQWLDAAIELPRDGYTRFDRDLDYAVAFGPEWDFLVQTAVDAIVARVRKDDWGDGGLDSGPVLVMKEHKLNLDGALKHPYTIETVQRFVPQGFIERLVRTGEQAIRRFVSEQRRVVRHHEQTDLSLVEAYLLVQLGKAALKPWLTDEEGRRLVRLVESHEDAKRGLTSA